MNPIVKPTRTPLPELDFIGHDAKSAPVFGERDITAVGVHVTLSVHMLPFIE